MDIIQFPGRFTGPTARNLSRFGLPRDADIDELLAFACLKRSSIHLMIDRSDLCRLYVETNPWVCRYTSIVEIDEEVMVELGITKVPQFLFFRRDSVIHHLIGTADFAEFKENRRLFLMKASKFRRPKSR